MRSILRSFAELPNAAAEKLQLMCVCAPRGMHKRRLRPSVSRVDLRYYFFIFFLPPAATPTLRWNEKTKSGDVDPKSWAIIKHLFYLPYFLCCFGICELADWIGNHRAKQKKIKEKTQNVCFAACHVSQCCQTLSTII